ncbi:MAG TPA: hypothetical protein VN947_34470 [Polyangia bacterium]|nr:hypothetical protein [Polyangia bacterium]
MGALSSVVVIDRGENHLFGTWHNVFVTMWRGRATLETMKRVSAVQGQLDKRFGGGYCALAVLSMSSLRMDAEMRDEAKRLTDNPGPSLRAIAQVILGTGLGAATTRMVASGLMLVRRSKTPSKLFDDVASAASWLLPHIRAAAGEGPATPAELVAAIERAWAQG